MSNEMLLNESYGDPRAPPPVHDTVHDLESFFWVLCWLVTMFQAPGSQNSTFPETARQFFMGSAQGMGYKKRIFIDSKRHRMPYLIDHVTAYFEPLKTTIDSLADLLKECLITQDTEVLYQKFLEELDIAENNCRIWRSNCPSFIDTGLTGENGENLYLSIARLEEAEQIRRCKDMLAPSQCDTGAGGGPS
jgi:hypothetical protein